MTEPDSAALPVRAVLFDVSGTLLDASAGDGTAPEVALADIIPASHPELLKDLRKAVQSAHAASPFPHPEIDIREMWAQLLPAWPEDEIERFARQVEDLLTPAVEMRGAAATLRGLASAGLTMGIISNAQFYTTGVMERCLGGTFEQLGFDPLLCWFSWEHRRAKPDPWLFETARAKLLERGISAGETLYVGNDVMRDIIPAAACGFRTALLVGSPELRLHGHTAEESGATYLPRGLEEILGIAGVARAPKIEDDSSTLP
ncbi:MAG: phosphoglycolate phosphatase [Akkermansiaceae bacterium]|nr:phosphoglycolate phosphatase [Akkermansiaceae bacterium]